MTFALGSTIGPYLITDQIGRGGMATVFKAHHIPLDRDVAIKVLHPAFKEDPGFLERFKREAQIVARLDHPNIIPVYDYADFEGQPYLVMRFIEGETLKSRLRHGPIPLPDMLALLDKVADALNYAHGQGILHRDIKPSNIMLDRAGTPFIADFGLARIAQAGESTLSQDMMLGTPQYISPEQAKGLHTLGPATDIYSLGIVIYEMIVGRVPFNADTPYTIIHDHIFKPLPLPSQVNPQVPQPIENVLLRALAKDPAARYATAQDMVADLRRAVQAAGLAGPDAPTLSLAESATRDTTLTLPPETPAPLSTLGPAYTLVPTTVSAPADSMQSRQAIRRRANLWIMSGVGGLLLTCLASLFIIARAVSDPSLQPWNIHDAAADAGDAVTELPPADAPASNPLPQLDLPADLTVEEAQALIDSQPGEVLPYFYLALAYAQAGERDQALSTLSTAITQLNPSSALILQAAHRAETLHLVEPAMWLYLEALTHPDVTPDVRNEAGSQLFTAIQASPLAARTVIAQYLDRRSPTAPVYTLYALALMQSSREIFQRQALAQLTTAFDLDPALPEAFLIRGLYYRANDQIDQALADWQQAAALPDSPTWVTQEAQRLQQAYQ